MQPDTGRLEPQGGAWARGALCGVYARGRPRPLSPGLTASLGDAALVRPLSPPPRSFPEPGILPFSPRPRPASPLRSDRDPSLGSSKARRGAGAPQRLPAWPIKARSVAGRGGGGGGEVTKMPQQQRMNRDPPSSSTPCAVWPFLPLSLLEPRRPLCLLLLGGRFCSPSPGPQLFLARPAYPSAGSVSPSTLLPFPSWCPLHFSYPGVPGQGLRARQ